MGSGTFAGSIKDAASATAGLTLGITKTGTGNLNLSGEGCSYTGDTMNIGFSANYLIEVLNNMSSQEVSVQLSDPSRAGVIVPMQNEENEDMLVLLMPIMLGDF